MVAPSSCGSSHGLTALLVINARYVMSNTLRALRGPVNVIEVIASNYSCRFLFAPVSARRVVRGGDGPQPITAERGNKLTRHGHAPALRQVDHWTSARHGSRDRKYASKGNPARGPTPSGDLRQTAQP